MLVVNSRLKIPLREFQFTFARSSGPGGQNVNKLNTKALLRWRVVTSPTLPEAVRRRLLAKQHRRVTSDGDLLITSQRFRDAGRNVADCLEKLRTMLAEAAVVPKSRRPTKPTRASQRRRLDAKSRQSQKKQQRRPKFDQ
ncbi:MAG TPA: alternative ribosome rescue aminoacyl-tRNA hydrolase ArfB [Thermoguttaceae bacterium]|nr:alternative ribosome rescue aminoacyl-tRNA hydrolase ArfB [Thermoguttaceae bacterium]